MKTTMKAAALSAGALMLTGAVLAATNIPLGIPDPDSPTAQVPSDKRPIITPQSIEFGAYDPHGDFVEDTNPKIEHLFLPWEDVDLSTLSIADEYALERGRSLMISVEPWSWAVDWQLSSDELYSGIMAGRFDANMAAVCREASQLRSPVTIRWGQEMDEYEDEWFKFTWAYWEPEQFVNAYRHAVSVCRQNFEGAQFIWSPKGKEGLEAFYPGDEYVDIVGLSIFGFQPYDNDLSGRDMTFAEWLEPAYERVKGFGKPIMVAELGYEGDQSYVRRWAEDVTKPYPQFPDLVAVVYFNDHEVYPWSHYGRPNWRVIRPRISN
jgi:beta-mannanase